MKVVWRLKQATVRDVYEALLEDRSIAYTTVLTMVKILERKGHIEKAESGRAPVYRATGSQRSTIAGMVSEFVDRVFNGAAKPLMMHLVEDRKLSKKDIAEIGRILSDEPRRADKPGRKGKKK